MGQPFYKAGLGEVAEWAIALDLKSSEVKASEGSNPSLSVCSSCFAFCYRQKARPILIVLSNPTAHTLDQFANGFGQIAHCSESFWSS